MTGPRRLSLAIAIGFCVAAGIHAVGNSHFRVDDYAHFAQSRQMPLSEFVRKPIDIHFAPLHRLGSALLYRCFPNRFPVAVALLVAIQIAALWTVDRLLERLRPSRWNGLWLMVFASHLYLIVALSYWTSGWHRIPFAAASALCVFAYVRFRDTGRTRDQLLVLLGFGLAMGFYSKSALLPPMLGALEWTLQRRPAAASAGQRTATFAGLVLLLGFQVLSYAFHPSGFAPLVPSFVELPATLAHGFSVFGHAPFGLVARVEASYPLAVGIVWGACAVASIYRSRFNAVVWLALVATIAAHIAMIGLSQRAEDLGALVAYIYRYQFELALPLVIFGKLIWDNLELSGLRRGPPWLRSPWWVPALAAGYALWMGFQSNALMRDSYGVNGLARSYALGLLESLPQGRPIALIDGRVPRFMWVYDTRLRRLSNFLPLLGFDARFDIPADELFRVDPDGAVGRVRPLANQTFEFAKLGASGHRMTRLSLDEAGCASVSDADGGVLELVLGKPTLLYRGFVSVAYRAHAAAVLRVATWDGVRERPEIAAGRELVLPMGRGERLVDISPAGLDPTRVHALELTIPGDGLCVETVRLVGYDVERAVGQAD